MANTAITMKLRVSNNNPASSLRGSRSSPAVAKLSCEAKGGFNDAGKLAGEHKRIVAPANVVLAEISAPSPVVSPDILPDLASVAVGVQRALLVLVKRTLRKSHSLQKAHLQLLFEKAIIDCRFFSLFAVAGSLLGSVLCFVEGCLMVIETYVHYFHALSQKVDQGHVMHLLIEAIDMFLVGTAMLIFGVGLYSMFVGSKSHKENTPLFAGSNFFGIFYMKSVPTWVEVKSISEAKSKLGHAIMMILQVGVLEKFQSVPLLTPLDLACFAATVLISSACILLLSKLSFTKVKTSNT